MVGLKTLVFFLAGLALAGLGCHLLWGHYEEERLCTSQTSGIVSEVQEVIVKKSGKSGSRVKEYVPIFTYAVGGIEYESSGARYGSASTFPVGRNVTVFYDPDNPGKCYLEDERQPPIGPVIFFAIGVVFMLASRPWRLFL